MHISLSDTVKATLKEFAQNRRKSMTAIIERGLVELFRSEEVNPKRGDTLNRVIDRKLTVPTGFSYRSFHLTLYMLGKKYPDGSAKDFWGAGVYRSAVDKTHGEILTEIQEEWKQELSG